MRKAIELASSADLSLVLEMRDFLHEVHLACSMIPMHAVKDFEQKMNTLVNSIHKVEQACFRRMIRKREFPEEERLPLHQQLIGQDEQMTFASDWRTSKRDREDDFYEEI
jgi:hypothetical protein